MKTLSCGIVWGLGLALALATGPVRAAPGVPREVWVACRTDNQPGLGTVTDPFDGSNPAKLNALFERFRTEYGANLVMHFGPGVFLGDRPWSIESNWKVRGAGIDITIFKTRDDPNGTETVGFRALCPPQHPWVSGFELSDATFDFNVLNLRKANRVFIYFPGARDPTVYYAHVGAAPQPWSPRATYRRGQLVTHGGAECIAVRESQDQAPGQTHYWSVLRPNQPEALPAWEAGRTYGIGEAVAADGQPRICAMAHTNMNPLTATSVWLVVNAQRCDPLLYATAADVWSGYGGGRNRARRVKLINGHGSGFFDREDFLIKLGGDDCVIEDCQVDLFHGDYSTCLVVFGGHNNVIRGCTVRGDGSDMLFAYGGWENLDTVFERNFAHGVRVVTNIDSLKSKNVIFRNNVFMKCRQAGIGINVSGGNAMDGLFIHDNFIELADDAPLAGIQVGSAGLSNVTIRNNTIRSVSGAAAVKAICIAGNARNVTVSGNIGESNMTCQVPPHAFCYDNTDLTGQPMKGIRQQPRGGAATAAGLDPLTPVTDPRPADRRAAALVAPLGPQGEVGDWLVLGPFPHPPVAQPGGITLGAGYDFDFLSTVGGEATVRPHAGQSVGVRFPGGPEAAGLWKTELLQPRRLAWQHIRSDRQGHVDALQIPALALSPDSTCVYAWVNLRSDRARRVVLQWGSDDGCVLYVRGAKIAEVRDDRRGYRRDQDRRDVDLVAGDNPILLKVMNYWGGFGWGLRVTAPDGQPASGLEITL